MFFNYSKKQNSNINNGNHHSEPNIPHFWFIMKTGKLIIHEAATNKNRTDENS